MPRHYWGDDFDFESLYEAQSYITKFVKRYSGGHLITKEKYGTIRYEWFLSPLSKPARWRPWMRWVQMIWRPYGKIILSIAVRNAINKWPHVKAEILADLWVIDKEKFL